MSSAIFSNVFVDYVKMDYKRERDTFNKFKLFFFLKNQLEIVPFVSHQLQIFKLLYIIIIYIINYN